MRRLVLHSPADTKSGNLQPRDWYGDHHTEVIVMTSTTSSTTKPFTERMHAHLMDVKSSLDGTVADIQSAGSRAGGALQSKRDEAQAAVEARRKEIEAANAKMKANVDAKKSSAAAAVAEWKAKRNIERLEHRADIAEDYATAAVDVAWGSFQEATAAILDAIVARADAEEAKVNRATA
jgi:hypothetical protein